MAALITRLLSHYWTADDPPETRQAQIEDWIVDLIEFGPEIIAAACGDWRRGQNRRPTIAGIRKLAIEERELRRPVQRALPPPPEERQRRIEARAYRDREMIAGGREIGARWARERGYDNLEAYAQAEGISYGEASFRVINTILAQPKGEGSVGQHLASAMGVKAREFRPNAEALWRGRIELGLEPEEPAA